MREISYSLILLVLFLIYVAFTVATTKTTIEDLQTKVDKISERCYILNKDELHKRRKIADERH